MPFLRHTQLRRARLGVTTRREGCAEGEEAGKKPLLGWPGLDRLYPQSDSGKAVVGEESWLIKGTKTVLSNRDHKSTAGSGGIRTHAPEETGALIQRLRPLGHTTSLPSPLNHGKRQLIFNKAYKSQLSKNCWQRWDSNPRPRRDWSLNPAP